MKLKTLLIVVGALVAGAAAIQHALRGQGDRTGGEAAVRRVANARTSRGAFTFKIPFGSR